MHRLLCWIECQQPEADAHRGLDRVRSDVMAEQLREDFHGQLAQSLPLGAQPVLERGLVDTDALEQRATVEHRRAFERVRGTVGGEALESRDINVHGGRVYAHRVVFFHEAACGRTRQPTAERDQRLSEAVAGALIGRVAPEERRQRVARVHLSGAKREICEQGFTAPDSSTRSLAGCAHQHERLNPIVGSESASDETRAITSERVRHINRLRAGPRALVHRAGAWLVRPRQRNGRIRNRHDA